MIADEFPAFRAFAMNILSRIRRAHTTINTTVSVTTTREHKRKFHHPNLSEIEKYAREKESQKEGWSGNVFSWICMRQSIPESINRLQAKLCDNSILPKSSCIRTPLVIVSVPAVCVCVCACNGFHVVQTFPLCFIERIVCAHEFPLIPRRCGAKRIVVPRSLTWMTTNTFMLNIVCTQEVCLRRHHSIFDTICLCCKKWK